MNKALMVVSFLLLMVLKSKKSGKKRKTRGLQHYPPSSPSHVLFISGVEGLTVCGAVNAPEPMHINE